MKLALETGKGQVNDILQMIEQNNKMIEQSVQPFLGQNIDIVI